LIGSWAIARLVQTPLDQAYVLSRPDYKGVDMNFRPALICIFAALSTFASAQQCGTYTGPYFIDGFGPPDKSFTQEPEPTLPPDSTALSLTITAPSNKAIVGTRTVQVYGSYAGPPATGVAINKVAAVQTATDFVGLVTLKPGVNTITIKATKLTGETVTQTRIVTYDPAQLPDVALETLIQGEHAPIKASYTLKVKAGLTMTRLQMDYEGDGSFELDSTNGATALSFDYKQPGFYPATATVTLDDGDPMTPPVIRTTVRRMAIVPLPLTRKTLCYVFYRMKNRLIANDIPDALMSMNAEIRAKKQARFSLFSNLPVVAQRFGIVVNGRIGIRLSELTVLQDTDEGQFGKSLTFERASDGVWRITSL
jgi:hypothetical protein